MAWCHQTTGQYVNQYWTISTTLYGIIIRPYWVEILSDWRRSGSCGRRQYKERGTVQYSVICECPLNVHEHNLRLSTDRHITHAILAKHEFHKTHFWDSQYFVPSLVKIKTLFMPESTYYMPIAKYVFFNENISTDGRWLCTIGHGITIWEGSFILKFYVRRWLYNIILQWILHTD